MEEKDFVNLDNARYEEQRKVMEEIRTKNICPFCPEHRAKFHKQETLKETTHWILTKNQWPYENTKISLMAIYKTHAEKLSDIPPEAGKELLVLAQWAEKEYNLDAGGLGMRFGDPRYNGGSVRHLHAQFLSADITDRTSPDYKPVRFRVG